MNIRKSVLTAAAAGLAMSLAACNGGSTTSSTSSSSSASSSESVSVSESAVPLTGSLTVWADETRIEAFTKVGEQFAKETGVKLEVVQKASADIKTDFIAQAPSGQGPDLIVGAHDWTGTLVENGVVNPVELGDAASGLSEVATRAFTTGGSLYGVPYAIENIALVRNNALATETPATFDDLVAQGAKLTPDFPVLIQQGDTGDAYHLYPIQTSFGAPVFNTDAAGDYTAELGMKGANGEKFAAYLKTLADQKVLSSAITGDIAKQSFIDGKSAYIVTGPWNISSFTDAGLDVSVLPVPSAGGETSAPFVGVQGVYLSAYSKNALAANGFLTYMASEDVQAQMYELGGRTPANTAAASAIDDETMAGFAEAGKDGQPMPAIKEMEAVWSFWGQAEVDIINGKTAPAAAWQTMITNIESKF